MRVNAMTVDSIRRKVTELEKTNAWNYILVGAAIMTTIVSMRNIYIYSKSIKEGKKLIGE